MKILSLDPGNNTGWCLLDTNEKRVVQEFGTTRTETEFYQLLEEMDDRFEELTVVCEDYINRPPKAGGFDHTWDKGFTHRMIGAVKHWSWQNKFKLVLQQPMIKPAMYGLLGMEYKKGRKDIHHLDAIVHGFKYIYDKKLLPQNMILGAMSGNKS